MGNSSRAIHPSWTYMRPITSGERDSDPDSTVFERRGMKETTDVLFPVFFAVYKEGSCKTRRQDLLPREFGIREMVRILVIVWYVLGF